MLTPYSILVIEPDLVGLADALDGEHYVVQAVHSVEDTLTVLDLFTPDVILVDLNLPEFTSLPLLSQLKERLPQTPLILVAGSADKASIVAGLELGAEDYLVKPLRPKDVFSRIRRILARGDLAGFTVLGWPEVLPRQLPAFYEQPPAERQPRRFDIPYWQATGSERGRTILAEEWPLPGTADTLLSHDGLGLWGQLVASRG